jgi:hypothetical protein
MTSPSEDPAAQAAQPAPPSDGTEPPAREPVPGVDFDPYRFGRPEHPIPPEFAPPGYTPPPPPPPAAPPGWGAGPSPYGPSSYGPSSYGPPPGGPYGYHPYGTPGPQLPPGVPAPPGHHAYVPPTPGRGKAVATLWLGVASIVLCWLSFFDAVPIVLAIVFGNLALTENRRRPGAGPADEPRSNARGLAVTGLVLCLIGAVLASILSVKVVKAVNRCGGFDQTSSSDFRQCLQDNY